MVVSVATSYWHKLILDTGEYDMHEHEILAHSDPGASQCGRDDFLSFTPLRVSAQH